MASDASRSSNGSADSYIGSLISLISKSENRYQGILHDLNTEESNIGLTNVHSFGTEGRKKDGPQVPPSDKVYEYILFRGRDIKDLQVKASPPVQSPQPIHVDPAIIQSQYSRTPSVSTSLPSAGSGPVADPGSHAAQMAIPMSTLQGGFPLYQPGGSLGSLASSTPLNSDGSGLSMPMPWQGFYPPLNSHAQQPFFQPTPGLSMPHSMQQPVYPGISAPLSTRSSNMIVSSVPDSNLLGFNMSAYNLPASNLRESTPPLLPPFSNGTANLTSMTPQSTLPPQSAVLASESLPSLTPNMVSSAVPTTASLSDTLPSVSQSTTSILDTNPITVPVTMPKMAPILSLPYQTAHHHVSPTVGTVKSHHDETSTPPLITPRQLLQPSDPAKKVAKVVQVTSSKPPASGPVTTQAPVLPLPPPPNHKMNGPPFHTFHNQTNTGGNGRSFIPSGNDRGHDRGRGNGRSFIPSGNDRGHERGRGNGIISLPSGNDRGRGRGRGNGISHHVTKFTEEFDFIAMNEKFKKDEVWGDLGKANKTKNREDDRHEDNGGAFKLDDDRGSLKLEKPVYVKDDFFDSISCDSLENGQHNGRRFREQRKVDGETFGDFPRHRGGRGGRWPGRGGHSRGFYYGTGYGYVGRGRGTN
ncbi:hypothetical protein AQUCO_00201075v1 [Aquilegia coerulea]|uniref:DFDF domain-containing protein n=1 Tax=Aquilegia coerulea TaxID=218851 RepID=A0A2G5F627_AQUCA|nr:hypothetical protein AQUCO_00201075v1 [Aquilegia coerulea]